MVRIGVFLLAACLAARGGVPSPEAWFGHRMGDDRKLVAWAKVTGYFDALAQGSDRIRIERIGNTVDGRPMIAAFIADASTLRNLDRYREIQGGLADPRQISGSEADALIAEGKPVVMITCSIHSTEVASTMTAVEFAHRMLTGDSARLRAIRANTILILVPSLNPDGVDIVERWYAKTLGTPFEGANPPELYQRYIGHDNNRDWYIFSQPETRNVVSRLHNVWHPQIVYDVHQQGAYSARMFVPPWLDPIDPNIDPILSQLTIAIGSSMAADLTSAGKPGIAVNALYDAWAAARQYQVYHGGLRILSESASARLATPIEVRPDELQASALGYNARVRSWNFLEPWPGGTWRVRDIVDYQLIAMESCLYQAALRREDLLENFYAVGKRAVARPGDAFLIPFEQFDPGSAAKLLETLAFGQVEIERSQAGYLVRLQQPYGAWAKTLLERQDYPDLRVYPGGPPKKPYDVTSQTLPLLMGVEVKQVSPPPASSPVAGPFEFGPPKLPEDDVNWWREANRRWAAGDAVTRRGSGRKLRRPRIGLYRSEMPSMDEGWTRWLLDRFGFGFLPVRNADLQSGNLNSRFDVLIFPDQSSRTLERGYIAGEMPTAYLGGIGEKAVAALREFAAKGGTAAFLNQSSEFAITKLHLPVRIVTRDLPEQELYMPGSILNGVLDTSHPLAAGLPARIAFWSEQSPAFDVEPGRGRVVVRYPEESVLASGWLLGEKHLKGKAALVDVPVGSGHVVLFGMRPQYRAQSYQTFKLLFNALAYFE